MPNLEDVFKTYSLKPNEKIVLLYIYSQKSIQNTLRFHISQLASALNISKGSIHIICYSLADHDLIELYKFSYMVEILPKKEVFI